MSTGNAFTSMAAVMGRISSAMFPEVCTVRHFTATAGVLGPVDDHTDVPCLVKKSGGGQDVDAIRGKQAYRVLMPADINGSQNVTKSAYKVVVAARGVTPQRTFQVHKVEQSGAMVTALCTIEG